MPIDLSPRPAEASDDRSPPAAPSVSAGPEPSAVSRSAEPGGRRFADFPVSPDVLEGLADLGFAYATEVQAATIEAILAGRDALVRAKAGTGRTAAFCVPIVERSEPGGRARALILAPGKALSPIGQLCAAIAKYRDVNVALLDDVAPIEPQEELLARGAEIVIGAPTRVRELHLRGSLDLSAVEIVCLDGADELLAAALEDSAAVLDATPDGRQVLLFSVALTDEIARLAGAYLHDPEQVHVPVPPSAATTAPAPAVTYEVRGDELRSLMAVLDLEDPEAALIVCDTGDDCAAVASFLDRQGIDVQIISGEPHGRRALQPVLVGDVQYLVATELSARGLDPSPLSHVLRLRRAGAPSIEVQRRRGAGGVDAQPLDPDAAARLRADRHARRLRESMGSLVFEAYLPTVRALAARPDGEALLAAALRAFFQADRQRRAAQSERGERRPRPDKRAERREPREPREPRAEARTAAPAEALDALLVAGPQPGVAPPPDADEADKKRKKRRRRRKKGKDRSDGADAVTADDGADEPADDDGPDDLDDLDALLTTDG